MKRSLAVLAVLLSACAGSGQWTRDGVTEAQLSADLSACRDQASEATERDRRIEYDIGAAQLDPRDDRLGTLREDLRTYNTTHRYHDIVDTCMRGRGYRPGDPDI